MKKISIVVPVYNGENYLGKCLESLVNQTLEEIEIIIVDDGSTDKTSNIIKKYSKKYPDKIVGLKKENGGQASARNLGLSKAKGDYILFVDSDDYISVDTCKDIYESAVSNNYDIVLFDYYIEKGKEQKYTGVIDKKQSGEINNKEYLHSTPAPWNKLFRKSFLIDNGFKFPEGIVYEDYAEIPTVILYNPKMYYLKKAYYYYYQSDNSTMRTAVYKKKFEDIFKASDYLFEKLKNKKGIEEELEYRFISHLLYEGSLNFYKYKKYDNNKKISKWIRKHYREWRKNEYYKRENFKYKLLCNLFYYNQIWLINLIRKVKKKNA